MRIRILDGADTRFTHTIEFPDLPTELLDLHHRLGRVARGTREVPATIVTLTRPPTSGTVENLPCQLALLPDATHPALNAKVVFRGLRAHLDARYGLSNTETTEAGRGTEVALRVFIRGFGAVYPTSADAQGPEDEAPDDSPRVRVMRSILARRGQRAFRDSLRARYGDRCVISGCTLLDVLEAAHIRPYRVQADNTPENGLLLRADLHTLFDLDYLGIEPGTLRVHLHPLAQVEPYAGIVGSVMLTQGQVLDEAALQQRWISFSERPDGGHPIEGPV